MTLEFSVNGTPLPASAILENPAGAITLPSSAWYGEVSSATVSVDDPFGDYDFRSWDVFTADEDAATNTRVFTGWIMTARITRGPYRDGPARVWELDIIDQNAALGFNYFRANSAQRGEETDLARVEFILESEPMAWTPVVAGALTNLTDNPVNLQEYDMVRSAPVEALTTAAGHAGKCFHVFWSHADAELQLYYDAITAYPAAVASISNVIADAGADVYYPFIDASLSRAGDQIYTGELIDFVGGSAFGESATTIDRLSPTPLSPISFKRMFLRTSDAIGRLETANAIIVSDLASQATEENTITVTIRVPAANVNDVEAGQRITVKFTHLPGYETDTDVNVIRRDVALTAGRTDMYDVTLELSDKAKLRELDGGDPDVFPPDPVVCDVDDITIVQWDGASLSSASPTTGASWPSPPTPGNLLICAWMSFAQQGSTPGDMDGWARIDDGTTHFLGVGGAGGQLAIYWKLAEEDEVTTPLGIGGNMSATNLAKSQNYLIEVAGVDTFDTWISGVNDTPPGDSAPGVPITPTADRIAFLISFIEWNTDLSGPGTPLAGVTELVEEGNISDAGNPRRWIGYMAVDGTTGSYDVRAGLGGNVTWAAVHVAFYCSGSDEDAPCLSPGQPSQEDEAADPPFGDGTTTTFATRCPFADDTLHVKVDNLNQDAAVTSYDGAAGTFTLGYAPVAGEQVTTNYIGRP